MPSVRFVWATLTACLLLTSCAQKSQAPESMALKLMRAQADENYESAVQPKKPSDIRNVNRIAVVCCALQDQPQELWQQVRAVNPDLVLVAGNTVSSLRADEKPLAAQYKKLDQNQDYKSLREQVPFMATWDEGDYGVRGGDGSYSGKKASKEAFVKYWNYIPAMKTQKSQGIEHAAIFESNGQKIQVIMLDTRFYSTALVSDGQGSYKKNWKNGATLLGASQWAWLKSELQKKADLRIVVSPLQIGANSFGGKRWGTFPYERQRFFDLLRATNVHNLIMVSGGRGFASLAKVDLIDYSPLYDVTVGPLNAQTIEAEQDRHYVQAPVSQMSFATIEWKGNNKTVSVNMIGDQGQKIQSLQVPLK